MLSAANQVVEGLEPVIAMHRETLEKIERSALVVQTNGNDGHRSTYLGEGSGTTPASPMGGGKAKFVN